MDQGRITAQGTYEELKNNSYMLNIKDIHQRNKDEIEKANAEANEKLQEARETLGADQDQDQKEVQQSEDKESKTRVLSDEEIQQTLKEFEGAKAELDEDTGNLIGKLLLNENDEKISADTETYYKLF